MKKKALKNRCCELELENALMKYLTENRQAFRQNTAEEVKSPVEADGLDFFEKNARESNMIEAVKALSPNKEKKTEIELALKEIRLELKQHSKRLKEVERKTEKCTSNIEKRRREIDGLDRRVSEAERVSAKWHKKTKKLRKDMKLVKQIFRTLAIQNGNGMSGESFKQLVSRFMKYVKKAGSGTVLIDAQ